MASTRSAGTPGDLHHNQPSGERPIKHRRPPRHLRKSVTVTPVFPVRQHEGFHPHSAQTSSTLRVRRSLAVFPISRSSDFALFPVSRLPSLPHLAFFRLPSLAFFNHLPVSRFSPSSPSRVLPSLPILAFFPRLPRLAFFQVFQCLPHSTSTIISISTTAPSGSEATPIAARACLPRSPKSDTSKSEQPLITCD